LVVDDRLGVSGAMLDGEQHLQHEFVSMWRSVGGDLSPPVTESCSAGIGEAEDFGAAVRRIVGFCCADQAVSEQAIEGRVHLADVQFPGATGRRLKDLLQAVAVAGLWFEEGQEPFFNGHGY